MFDVFGFYKFIKISYLKKNQKILHNHLLNKNIRGTVIISKEGLNGTISGKNKDIKLIKDYLYKLFKFENLLYKYKYFFIQPYITILYTS